MASVLIIVIIGHGVADVAEEETAVVEEIITVAIGEETTISVMSRKLVIPNTSCTMYG